MGWGGKRKTIAVTKKRLLAGPTPLHTLEANAMAGAHRRCHAHRSVHYCYLGAAASYHAGSVPLGRRQCSWVPRCVRTPAGLGLHPFYRGWCLYVAVLTRAARGEAGSCLPRYFRTLPFLRDSRGARREARH